MLPSHDYLPAQCFCVRTFHQQWTHWLKRRKSISLFSIWRFPSSLCDLNSFTFLPAATTPIVREVRPLHASHSHLCKPIHSAGYKLNRTHITEAEKDTQLPASHVLRRKTFKWFVFLKLASIFRQNICGLCIKWQWKETEKRLRMRHNASISAWN